jgi:hypothetical protein
MGWHTYASARTPAHTHTHTRARAAIRPAVFTCPTASVVQHTTLPLPSLPQNTLNEPPSRVRKSRCTAAAAAIDTPGSSPLHVGAQHSTQGMASHVLPRNEAVSPQNTAQPTEGLHDAGGTLSLPLSNISHAVSARVVGPAVALAAALARTFTLTHTDMPSPAHQTSAQQHQRCRKRIQPALRS